MYRLLIADDETRDRNIARILLNKQYTDQFEFLEAKNGAQALEMIREEHIDLLLLDLNMPGLSGMDVIREIGSSVYTIILTAYSFFDDAREAMHYGVRDYILKPPVRKELFAAIDRFLEEQRKSTPQAEVYQKHLILRELAAQLLFYGNRDKIKSFLSLFSLDGLPCRLAVYLNERQNEKISSEVLIKAEEYLDTCTIPYAAAEFRRGIAIIVFEEPDSDAEKISHIAEQTTKIISTKLALAEAPCTLQDLPTCFLKLCNENDSFPGLSSPDLPVSEIENCLRAQDFQGAISLTSKLVDQSSWDSNPGGTRFRLLQLLSTVTKDLFASANKRGVFEHLSVLIDIKDRELLLSATAEFLQWVISEINQSVYTNSYQVHRVIDTVMLDCSKDWTIELLAAKLNISPYYLSHLFKDYTGQSFTQYLTDFRIEKAVELMRVPEYSLSQIGEMVGYDDPNYFSRVFKKKKGINARDFRKQLLSE